MVGEVKIRVKLTNAVDEGMAHRGRLETKEIRTESVEAMVDTGAVNSVLPPALADRLGLRRRSHQMVEYAVDCRFRSVLPNPAHPHQPVVKVKSWTTATGIKEPTLHASPG